MENLKKLSLEEVQWNWINQNDKKVDMKKPLKYMPDKKGSSKDESETRKNMI